ncbi:MAG: outer membrane beta-barrel protein [Smithella sp.]
MTLHRTILAIIMFLCILTAPYVYAADILSQIHPYISVSGEYDDNINLTANNKIDDFITTILPGIKFSNMDADAKSGIDLNVSAGAVFYDKNPDLNYFCGSGLLNAKYMTSEHVNFYLQESYLRSDSSREPESFTSAADNEYYLSTLSQRSVYSRNVVAPTVEYQFDKESSMGVNYRNDIYQTSASVSENSIENYINPFITYWFDERNGMHLDYAYTNGDFEASPDLNGQKVTARYMNRLNQNATAFVEGAYTNESFALSSGDYNIYEPSLGLSYVFTPSLKASAQIGYYWMEYLNQDPKYNGLTFKADLTNTDALALTTYALHIQGGYIEDYFTSQNLGFQKYYRATGSINHYLEKRFSVGCSGSVERVEYVGQERVDTIWGVGASASYQLLKWLTLSLELSHNADESNSSIDEYIDNRGILRLTATY